MSALDEGNVDPGMCFFRHCSSRNSSSSSNLHHNHHNDQQLDSSNDCSKNMEAVLTLDDIEELTRRRDQLRTDVATSLVRIAEIRAWVANTTTTTTLDSNNNNNSSSSKDHTSNNNKNNNSNRNHNSKKSTSSSSMNNPLQDPSRSVSAETVSAARGRLRAARAAVSAVPLSEWRSLRRLRPLPLAAAAVVDAASSLLGESFLLPSSQSAAAAAPPSSISTTTTATTTTNTTITTNAVSSSSSSAQSKLRGGMGWRVRLLRLEPGDVAEAAVHAVRRRRFVAVWPYDRVRPVHAALGPLHRWITAMLDTREAERGAPHQSAEEENINSANSANHEREGNADRHPHTAAARVGSETAALLRELEEHAEYVQMAKDELAAIDALLADAVREAEKCGVEVVTACPSPTVCSETAAPSSEASRSIRTEWGETMPATNTTNISTSVTGRTTPSAATHTGTPRIHLQQKQKQRQKIKEKEKKQTFRRTEPLSRPQTSSSASTTARTTTRTKTGTIPNTMTNTTNEKSETVMTVVVPPIVPKLALQSCIPQTNGPATPSLRARLEQLRTSPRIRSPRLGRAIHPSCAHSTTSNGGGGGRTHSQNAHHTTDSNINDNTTNINNTNSTAGDSHMLYTGAEVLQERADLLQRVHELEDRLKEAYQRNPREAEFQLMRDEMNAARDEIAALRAERSQLLEKAKRYSLYRFPTTLNVDSDAATTSVPNSTSAGTTTSTTTTNTGSGNSENIGLMSVRIRELEEQLHAAHAHIYQLEAQTALSALRALENPSSLSSSFETGVEGGGGGERVSKEKNGINPATIPTLTGSNNSKDHNNNNNNNGNNSHIITTNSPTTATTTTTTIAEKRGEGNSNSNNNGRNTRSGDMILQKQLNAALQQAETHRTALAATEERLNQEIHAHRASEEKQQLLQAELTSVWKRLENTEYQLKLILEERGEDVLFNGEPYSSAMALLSGSGNGGMHSGTGNGSLKGMAALRRELQQARLREMEQQQELERLRIELGTLQRRYMEHQQQQKQVRAARAEMLRRLEKTFAEALRRQECELEAIPNALQRARSEIERISAQRR